MLKRHGSISSEDVKKYFDPCNAKTFPNPIVQMMIEEPLARDFACNMYETLTAGDGVSSISLFEMDLLMNKRIFN